MRARVLQLKKLGGEGTLTEKDLDDFTLAKKLLLAAFKSGKSLSIQDMRLITGQDQADRRMRELRAEGWRIVREHQGGRYWKYKLETPQGSLFK